MDSKYRSSRRQFVKLALAGVSGVILAACAPKPTAVPTKAAAAPTAAPPKPVEKPIWAKGSSDCIPTWLAWKLRATPCRSSCDDLTVPTR